MTRLVLDAGFFFSSMGPPHRLVGDIMNQGLLGVVGVLILSCSGGARESAEAPVLRAWDPLVTTERPAAKRAAGEDCSSTGRAGCGNGVCLHVEPHVDRGYLCSKQCAVDDDCPETWSCRAMVPGDAVSFCVPPRGWQPAVAATRALRAPSPNPTMLMPSRPAVDGGRQ